MGYLLLQVVYNGSSVVEIGKAIWICIATWDKALKLKKAVKGRTDKWAHAYVGCVLRRNDISPAVASLMAGGKEGLDFIEDILGKTADSSMSDYNATMRGYWNAYLGARKEKVNKGCGIVAYEYVYLPSCEEVCDFLYLKKYRKNYSSHRDDRELPHKECFFKVIPIEQEKKKFREVRICIEVDITNPDYRNYKYPIFQSLTRELAKSDKEEAERILKKIEEEYEWIEVEDDSSITREINNSNKTIYRQVYSKLKKHNVRGLTTVKFLLNSNKKEIHNLKKISPLCNLDLLKSKHRLYLRNKKFALRALAQGFDGCKHCMTKYHTK